MAVPATRNDALKILRNGLGQPNADFREGQWEAIDMIVNQRQRLLCVQRTGWGKSWVYFLSTRILRDRGMGPTLIVSPLLALMRNQIEGAERLRIKALTINSSNTSEWDTITKSIMEDDADLILISPERLANDNFVKQVLLPIGNRVSLLVVDESHCISDWGHDFRPDYRRLTNVLKQMPSNMPVLGTTATANNRVINDVSSQLGNINIQRGSLARDSLALQTISLPDQASRLAWLAQHLPDIPGTGIIYTLTTRDAEQVAQWLTKNNIKAAAYHSRIEERAESGSKDRRQELEAMLLNNGIKALVSTTALGMGFDKPDLAFVIHFQAPGSVVAYYQQVGRAGRAIDKAFGILLSGSEDRIIHEYFRKTAFPSEKNVNEVLKALSESDGLTVREIEENVNLSFGQIEKVLKLLSVENPAPVYLDSGSWRRTPVNYKQDTEKIERLTRQRELEWQEVQEYINTGDCYMAYLSRSLDDDFSKPCGRCSNCIKQPLIAADFHKELVKSANLFLGNLELEFQCKKQAAKGAFKEYNFIKTNLPKQLKAETGRILCRSNFAPWGKMVVKDKASGLFSEDLIAPMVEMIRKRWKPEPSPGWLTCVPSSSRPDLVTDFAKRLADRLGLPFHVALVKARKNQPQSSQFNRFHQCSNLDGAFSVNGVIPDAPVLLFDDMVDSAWTMTVAAALLLASGSGPVWPVALTTMNPGL